MRNVIMALLIIIIRSRRTSTTGATSMKMNSGRPPAPRFDH